MINLIMSCASCHVILEISKGDFRFDHPELRRVALGIGLLRAEGRPERVDLPECQRHALAFKLSGNRQGRRLLEEVLRIIDLPAPVRGTFSQVERRDAEHLPRALAVARCNQRGMRVDEPALLEKFVNGKRRSRPHTERRAEECSSAGRRCAMVRRYSTEWRFFCSG